MMALATYKRARISPYKLRLVAEEVCTLPVDRAMEKLAFSPQKGAAILRKVLESAIANADENEGADIDMLKIESIRVDQGPVLKRLRPRARGRSDRITKRTSHVTVIVSEIK